MDGIACLRAMRQQHSARRPGIAIFTADWDVCDREHEIRALDGTVAFKLCDLDGVHKLVDTLIHRSRMS